MRLACHTYRGWLITKEERLIGQHVGQNLEVILTELYDFFWLVHTHSLCLHFLGSLQMLHMHVRNPSYVHNTRTYTI